MTDRVVLPRATDGTGEIVPGARAYFYLAGTTTPATIYTNSAGTIVAQQPVQADSQGVFAPTFSTVALKVDIQDTAGASLPGFPSDLHYQTQISSGGASQIGFSATAEIAETNVQDAIEEVQENISDVLVSPAFTGTPLAPQAPVATGTNQIATCSFVRAEVLDEDDFASNAAGRPPSQQSTKAYVDAQIAASGEYTWTDAVATTSGTEIEIATGIPAGTNEVLIFADGVSTGGADVLVQLGNSIGYVQSGYLGSGVRSTGSGSSSQTETTGFLLRAGVASDALDGKISLHSYNTIRWFADITMSSGSSNGMAMGGGSVPLGTALTRIRVSVGSGAFDAGSMRVGYR